MTSLADEGITMMHEGAIIEAGTPARLVGRPLLGRNGLFLSKVFH
jgi:hypothetical protein